MPEELLRLERLRVAFPSPYGELPGVREVGFVLQAGAAVAMVGESGCGKSLTALSILGLIPPPGRIVEGEVWLAGREISSLSVGELRSIRGQVAGMVFQDPMTSLNPVFSVGYQVAEAVTAHRNVPAAEVRRRCIELLGEVGVPDAANRLRAYPGQLSGGLRQRVMIAIAIAGGPRLLIADEPTTALDVTIQAQIMALLGRLRRERNMALLLVTHDLGLVAQNADRVLVMYAGYVVEAASTQTLFKAPLHPYTRGLIDSLPAVHGSLQGRPLRAIPGAVPHPSQVPLGCPFRDRCPEAVPECALAVPALELKRAQHRVRCIRVTAHV